MSARAAWRLESLGFSPVYRYTPGKADWLANGLPSEGRDARSLRAGDVADRDVPTCGLSERLGEVRRHVQGTGAGGCIVVNAERIVLGRVRGEAWDGPDEATIEEVMEPGPTTVRLNEPLEDLVKRLRTRRVESIVVTDTDGHLIGVLHRDAAERHLAR
jgi:CBS domain-containing protein